MISGSLAEILKKRRGTYNSRFEQVRRTCSALDGDAFLEHLSGILQPVVEAVHEVLPDRSLVVSDALYDLLLRLFAAGLLGSQRRCPPLRVGLPGILSAAPVLVAHNPGRLCRSVANAILTLCAVPDVRIDAWIGTMKRLAARTISADDFLCAGQAAAWRQGMAHFRGGALSVCRHLPPQLALIALDMPGGDPGRLPAALDRLESDPWLDMASAMGSSQKNDSGELRIVRRVGGFRGFGGPFLEPPRLALSDGIFLACDRERCVLITADYYGATLHASARRFPGPSAVDDRLDPAAEDLLLGNRQLAETLVDRTCAITDGATVAVTTRSSHCIFLVAHG